MKDPRTGRSMHWRWVRLCVVMMGLLFFCLFFQAWRVYAFDVQHVVAADAAKRLPSTSGSSGAKQAVPAEQPPKMLPVVAKDEAKPDRWSDGEVVSALSSFYQTIITFMGLLLGLVGILAVVTLRFLSKAAAEDIAHESAKSAIQHYLDTRKFADDVSNAVEETGLAKQLEVLERELAIVKRLLQERQERADNANQDDEDADGTVSPAPAGGGK